MADLKFYVCFVMYIICVRSTNTSGLPMEPYGCYLDIQTFTNDSMTNETHMSKEMCGAFCRSRGFEFVGLSAIIRGVMFITGAYDLEVKCSCLNAEPEVKVNDSLCIIQCPQNAEQMCGGLNSSLYNVYKINSEGQSSGNEQNSTVYIVAGVVACIIVVAVIILFGIWRFKIRKSYRSKDTKEAWTREEKETNYTSNQAESYTSLKAPNNQYIDTIYHDDENNSDDDDYEPVGEPVGDPKYYYIDESIQKPKEQEVPSGAVVRIYDTIENPEQHAAIVNDGIYYNTRELQQQEYEVPKTNTLDHLYLQLNDSSKS